MHKCTLVRLAVRVSSEQAREVFAIQRDKRHMHECMRTLRKLVLIIRANITREIMQKASTENVPPWKMIPSVDDLNQKCLSFFTGMAFSMIPINSRIEAGNFCLLTL